MANEVGRLFVSLGLNSSDFHKKLTAAEKAAERQSRSMQREFEKMVKPVEQAFALIAGASLGASVAIGIMVKKTAEFSDNMDDASKRTGIAVERLQTLNYAAKISGTSMESLEKGIKILSNNMLDASRNTGTAKITFNELGIAVKNTDGSLRKTTDVLSEAADKISKMTDATKQAAFANDLFGKSSTMLLPLLKLGADGMAELEGNLRKYGYVMSSKEIAAGETFNDNLLTMQMALEGLSMRFSSKLIPVLDSALTKTLEWVASNKDLINQKMDDVVGKIGQGFKLIADNKDGIIAVFQAVALASEAILKSASGYMMILDVMTKLGKAQGAGAYNIGGRVGYQYQPKGSSANNAGGYVPLQSSLSNFNPSMLGNWNKIFDGSTSGGSPSADGGGGGTVNRFRTSRFGLAPYGWDTDISGNSDRYKSGAMGLMQASDVAQVGLLDNNLSKGSSNIEEHSKQVKLMQDRWISFGDTMSNVLANSVMQSGNTFKNISDAFTRMLETMLVQLAAKAAVFGLLNLFTGGAFGKGMSVMDFAFGGGRASGGSVQSGTSYLVGEKGPEMFTPQSAGKITPNSQINDHSSLVINFNNSEKDEMTRMSDIQLAERIKRVTRNFNLQAAY